VPRRATELFTEAELTRFLEAAHDQAHAQGGVFVLDESVVLAGPRREATYLRDEMARTGVNDLADRIEPSEYAEGVYEQWRRKVASGAPRPGRGIPAATKNDDDEIFRTAAERNTPEQLGGQRPSLER